MSCVFYGENTLDKSLFRKKSWRSMLLNTDIPTSNSMLMMVFPARPLTALAFNR